MEKSKIDYYLKLYEEHNGCNCYEVYFCYKKAIYKIELKNIPSSIVKLTRESSRNGGKEKLRLYVNSATKQAWLLGGNAKKVMTEENLLKKAKDLNLNKGQYCEYLSSKARKLEYKLDNTRFDVAGDVNLKRKKIQVKYENASLAQLDTILKVANS